MVWGWKFNVKVLQEMHYCVSRKLLHALWFVDVLKYCASAVKRWEELLKTSSPVTSFYQIAFQCNLLLVLTYPLWSIRFHMYGLCCHSNLDLLSIKHCAKRVDCCGWVAYGNVLHASETKKWEVIHLTFSCPRRLDDLLPSPTRWPFAVDDDAWR